MTVAICLRCGTFKHGAWTACASCGYDPSGDGLEAEARSLWLTDHHRSLEQLQEASRLIQQGQIPAFDEAFLEEATRAARAEGKTTLMPSGLGCVRMALPMLLMLAALIGLGVWLVMRWLD